MSKPTNARPDPALLALAERDPRAAYERAQEIEEMASAVKVAAVRAALRRCSGLQAPAAELLGIGRTTLQYVLRRNPDLAREAAKMRPKGYTTGRPPRAE